MKDLNSSESVQNYGEVNQNIDNQLFSPRSLGSNPHSNSLVMSSEYNEEPILFANIHISGDNQSARLVLFEGENPKLVVATFCKKHGKLIVFFPNPSFRFE